MAKWTLDCLVDWLIVPLADWSIHRLIDWLIDWSHKLIVRVLDGRISKNNFLSTYFPLNFEKFLSPCRLHWLLSILHCWQRWGNDWRHDCAWHSSAIFSARILPFSIQEKPVNSSIDSQWMCKTWSTISSSASWMDLKLWFRSVDIHVAKLDSFVPGTNYNEFAVLLMDFRCLIFR